MAKEQEMAVQLKEYIDALEDGSEATIDNFYDSIGIKAKHRSDYITAALFKQYYELINKD